MFYFDHLQYLYHYYLSIHLIRNVHVLHTCYSCPFMNESLYPCMKARMHVYASIYARIDSSCVYASRHCNEWMNYRCAAPWQIIAHCRCHQVHQKLPEYIFNTCVCVVHGFECEQVCVCLRARISTKCVHEACWYVLIHLCTHAFSPERQILLHSFSQRLLC